MAASSGQGSQDPADTPADTPGCAAKPFYHISEKNTFVHVDSVLDNVDHAYAGDFSIIRRQVSAPASTTNTSKSETESDTSLKSVDPPPSFPTSAAPAKQEEALSDSSDEDDLDLQCEAEEREEAPQEGEGGANGSRRRHQNRPCKSQRARFKKLKGYLEADVRCDPHGFDFSKCYLPPSVAKNRALCAKLAAGLEELRNNLISEGAVPVAGDASQSLALSSLPAPGQAMGSRDSPSLLAPGQGPLLNGRQPSRTKIISL